MHSRKSSSRVKIAGLLALSSVLFSTTVTAADPCKAVGDVIKSGVKKGNDPVYFPAKLAYNCLKALPLNQKYAQQTADGLLGFHEVLSYQTYFKNPPTPELEIPVWDGAVEIQKIQDKVKNGKYQGLYDFAIDVYTIFRNYRDGHTSFMPQVLTVFRYAHPFSIVSVADGPTSIPKIWTLNEQRKLDKQVTEINGQPVVDYLINLANSTLEDFGFADPDTRFNILMSQFPTTAPEEQENMAYFQYVTQYPGDQFTMKYADGSTEKVVWSARLHHSETDWVSLLEGGAQSFGDYMWLTGTDWDKITSKWTEEEAIEYAKSEDWAIINELNVTSPDVTQTKDKKHHGSGKGKEKLHPKFSTANYYKPNGKRGIEKRDVEAMKKLLRKMKKRSVDDNYDDDEDDDDDSEEKEEGDDKGDDEEDDEEDDEDDDDQGNTTTTTKPPGPTSTPDNGSDDGGDDDFDEYTTTKLPASTKTPTTHHTSPEDTTEDSDDDDDDDDGDDEDDDDQGNTTTTTKPPGPTRTPDNGGDDDGDDDFDEYTTTKLPAPTKTPTTHHTSPEDTTEDSDDDDDDDDSDDDDDGDDDDDDDDDDDEVVTSTKPPTPTQTTTTTEHNNTTNYTTHDTNTTGYPEYFNSTTNGNFKFYILDGDLAVLDISSFRADTRADRLEASDLLDWGLDYISATGVKYLIIDLTNNGGGAAFLPFDFTRLLFPKKYIFESVNMRYTKQNYVYLRNSNLDAWWTTQNKDWPSLDALFSPVERDGDKFTQMFRYDHLQITEEDGYGVDPTQKQLFPADNIVVLGNGYCGSACFALYESLYRQGVRSYAMGGRPNGSKYMQTSGGIKGGVVASFDTFTTIKRFYEAFSDERAQKVAKILPGPLRLWGAWDALNIENQFRNGEEDQLPLEFRYNAACKRFSWTKEMMADTGYTWKFIRKQAWGQDGKPTGCEKPYVPEKPYTPTTTTTTQDKSVHHSYGSKDRVPLRAPPKSYKGYSSTDDTTPPPPHAAPHRPKPKPLNGDVVPTPPKKNPGGDVTPTHPKKKKPVYVGDVTPTHPKKKKPVYVGDVIPTNQKHKGQKEYKTGGNSGSKGTSEEYIRVKDRKPGFKEHKKGGHKAKPKKYKPKHKLAVEHYKGRYKGQTP